MKISKKIQILFFWAFFGIVFTSCREACFQCTGHSSFGDAEYCDDVLGTAATDLAVAKYEEEAGAKCKKN